MYLFCSPDLLLHQATITLLHFLTIYQPPVLSLPFSELSSSFLLCLEEKSNFLHWPRRSCMIQSLPNFLISFPSVYHLVLHILVSLVVFLTLQDRKLTPISKPFVIVFPSSQKSLQQDFNMTTFLSHRSLNLNAALSVASKRSSLPPPNITVLDCPLPHYCISSQN